MNAFEVRFDALGVGALADQVAGLDAERLGGAMLNVVNALTARFDEQARRGMNAGIALDDRYVSGRMTTVLAASVANPSATITARGPREGGLTILGHYSPRVTYAPAKGHAKGDPKRGVPPGQRANGVQVEVTRGRPKIIPGAFTMTLRRGTVAGDQVGVFVRELGKVRHLYGVAPYSLFRHQVSTGIEALSQDLNETATAAVQAAVAKVFA